MAVFPDILADYLVVAFEAVLHVGLVVAFVASEAVPEVPSVALVPALEVAFV